VNYPTRPRSGLLAPRLSDGIPAEALSWLASWLALAPDESWTTEAKRELVRRAHELFKQRGTRQGLRALLGIYLADRASRPPAWEWAIDRQREIFEDRLDRTLFVWERSDLDCIEDDDLREPYERLVPCQQCFAVQ